MENISNRQHFAQGLLMIGIEQELRELYKKEFNIDDIERQNNTYSKFTPEEQIERYAKHVTFWMNLLKQHNVEVGKSGDYDDIDQAKRYMLLDKIGCIKQRAESTLGCDQEVYKKYKNRVKELLE